jgi:hypothetical protein
MHSNTVAALSLNIFHFSVPRKAKQAIGGIAKLKNAKTGEERYVLAFDRSAPQPMQ